MFTLSASSLECQFTVSGLFQLVLLYVNDEDPEKCCFMFRLDGTELHTGLVPVLMPNNLLTQILN